MVPLTNMIKTPPRVARKMSTVAGEGQKEKHDKAVVERRKSSQAPNQPRCEPALARSSPALAVRPGFLCLLHKPRADAQGWSKEQAADILT
jgi:hypothetical protein